MNRLSKYRRPVVNAALSGMLTLCIPLLVSCSFDRYGLDRHEAASVAPACLPGQCLEDAIGLIRAGRQNEAEAGLKAIVASYPETDWAGRASYLLGLASLDGKSSGNEAVAFFTNASGLAAIEDYVLFNIARAYETDGQFEHAAALYDAMEGLYPDSVLIRQAQLRRAGAFYSCGEYESARAAFDSFVAAYPDSVSTQQALLASARAAISMNKPEQAVQPLRKLRIRYPSGTGSGETQSLVSVLDSLGVSMPELTRRERLEQADALFSAQLWSKAIAAYAFVDSPDLRPAALIKTAEAMQRLRHYNEAETALNKYLDSDALGPSERLTALRMLTTSLIRQDKADGLDSVLKDLRRIPDSQDRASTILAVARFYETKGDQKAALDLYKELLDSDAGTTTGREAAWSIGWNSYSNGRYAEAAELFSANCADSVRCLYWSGRAYEKAGLDAAYAVDAYRKVCANAETSYYCRLAAERAPDAAGPLRQDESIGLDTEAGLNSEHALFADGRYLAAKELNLLGLTREAATELDRLASDYPIDADSALILTRLFYQTGDIYRGLRAWRRYGWNVKVSQTRSLPLAYPSQAVDLAARHSDARLADPYLIASVMREESAFNTEALSRAGAVGLMQLMPSTAGFIAKRTKAPGFTIAELRTRETNIMLGSRYLDYLLGIFNNNVIYAVAAYNAGPGAVRDWLNRFPREPDEFVESIPFPETREYTKRVLASYTQFVRGANARPDARPLSAASEPLLTAQ